MKTKTIKIDPRDIQLPGFVTPPENQGQAVTRSYACTEDYILEKTYDASDNSVSIEAYEWPEDVEEGEWGPQNGTPRLGRRLGPIEFA